MKKQFLRLKDFLLHRKLLAGVMVFLLLGAGYYFYQMSKNGIVANRYLISPVEKGTIVVAVSGTGQVTASGQIDVKSQAAGLISQLNIKQGDFVKAGQLLALIDQRSAAASIASAKASVAQAQANYSKVIAGTANEEINISKASVDSATQALENAKKNYEGIKLQQTQAVKNSFTAMINSSLEAVSDYATTTVEVTVSGSYSGQDEGSVKIGLNQADSGYYLNINGVAGANYVQLIRGIPVSVGQGLYVTLSTSGTLSGYEAWTINLPNKRANNYLTNYNVYQSALIAEKQALQQAQVSIDNAQQSLEQANLSLLAKQIQVRPEDIAAAQASIDSAMAQLQSAENTASNNRVVAPFDGQVATVGIQKGDLVGSGTVVATLVTKEKMTQISLNEVDIAKIKIGQKATLKIDALNGLTFAGQVTGIDVLGTTTQGVVSYNVKVLFVNTDPSIKPGMSVSAAIITDVKQDILTVPNSAIKIQGEISYVEMIDPAMPIGSLASDGSITTALPLLQQQVEIGIANDTLTEIVSGIKEGDQIVTKTIKATNTITQTSGSLGGLRIPGVTGGGATTPTAIRRN